MKNNKTYLLVSLLMLIASSIMAQSYKGTVIDESGESIPGVNVIIKGTTIGVSTDLDGTFLIETSLVPENLILEYSFLGFITREVIPKANTSMTIVLKEDRKQLDELVVVGYEIVRKSDLTGSVSELSSEDLAQVPVSSVDQALQGKAAGVNVTQATGAPGEGVSVRIRGVGSVNSDNAPLYIVDGVPTQDALSTIAPDNIASVSVLKDAASAAIYGSRANNGVVIITTKKGHSGKTKISFSTTAGVQMHGKLTEMANTKEYAEIYNEAASNDNALIDNSRLHRAYISDDMVSSLPDVNHLEEIFTKALISNSNLSISGGDDKTQFRISGNYFSQDGIIVNSNYERLGGAAAIESKVTDRLTIGTNINLSSSNSNSVGSSGDGYGGNGGSVVRYALFRSPALPVYNEDGSFYDYPENPELFGDGYNPVGVAMNTDNKKNELRLFGDVHASYQIAPSLSFSSTYGLDLSDSNQRRFDKTWGTNDRINNPNTLSVSDGRFTSWTWTNRFNYAKTFNNVHSFSAVAGSEAIHSEGYESHAYEKDFVDQDPNLVYLGNGQGMVVANEDTWGYSLLSFFGRANYAYQGKYMFSATVREDGSSRFAKDNRWGTFYSASAGWRIDQEEFMKDVDKISNLKFRASYGVNGNQNIGYYAYSDRMGSNYNYPFGNVSYDGYAQSMLGNEDVKWETSRQFDIGIDLGMWAGQFNMSVDYFHKITSDMLTQEPIPTSGGYASPAWVNNGTILNNGVELELGYSHIWNDFNLDVTGNVAWLHNEVLELESPIYGGRIDNGVYATKTQEGQPIGAFYLYEMDGIYQNELEILTSAYQSDNVMPGDVKYKDQNGDGVIDENDRAFVGSAIPNFTAGLNIALQYKQFDAVCFFQGAFGHDIYYQVATDIEGFYRPFNVTQRYYDERWTGEGTSNTQPRASWTAKSNNTKPSTRFLEKGNYVRLKNLQVGYTFSAGAIRRMHMDKLRLYFMANNVLTFTNYPGLDPEMSVSDNSKSEGDRAAGIDWGTYPSAVSYNLGLQLTF